MEKDNKNVFATNLNNLMALHDKSRRDLSDALGISYFTITAWTNGTKYPRMDKVEMLANYFGVLKSDLIEEAIEPTKPIENTVQELTEGEKMLLELFRKVPENQQQMVLQMISAALKTIE
jgi:transcriptional regulator with XRE-family HTH domain